MSIVHVFQIDQFAVSRVESYKAAQCYIAVIRPGSVSYDSNEVIVPCTLVMKVYNARSSVSDFFQRGLIAALVARIPHRTSVCLIPCWMTWHIAIWS